MTSNIVEPKEVQEFPNQISASKISVFRKVDTDPHNTEITWNDEALKLEHHNDLKYVNLLGTWELHTGKRPDQLF